MAKLEVLKLQQMLEEMRQKYSCLLHDYVGITEEHDFELDVYDIKQAIAAQSAPAQEPVAYVSSVQGGSPLMLGLDDWHAQGLIPLYTRSPAAPVQEPVKALLQSKQNFERNFGPSSAADWIYADLAELLDTTPPAQSKPLTNAQIDDLAETHCTSSDADCLLYTFTTEDLRELIEAAHGIKD